MLAPSPGGVLTFVQPLGVSVIGAEERGENESHNRNKGCRVRGVFGGGENVGLCDVLGEAVPESRYDSRHKENPSSIGRRFYPSFQKEY